MEIKKNTKSRKDVERALTDADGRLVAKKDWHIVQNNINIKIKEGEPIPELPEHLLQALKTENVI